MPYLRGPPCAKILHLEVTPVSNVENPWGQVFGQISSGHLMLRALYRRATSKDILSISPSTYTYCQYSLWLDIDRYKDFKSLEKQMGEVGLFFMGHWYVNRTSNAYGLVLVPTD
jgi:hypothetical protein